MRHAAANVLSVLIVLGLVVLAMLGLARQAVDQPGPLTEQAVVQIPRGASVREISDLLAEAGALPEGTFGGALEGASLFRLAANYSGQAQNLKFGEYAIEPGASVSEIVALIAYLQRLGNNARPVQDAASK